VGCSDIPEANGKGLGKKVGSRGTRASSVARIVPVIPIRPDSLAGALEVLIDLVADANSPDRGKPVFGSECAHADGDLPGAHALVLHNSGFEIDVMDVFEFMLKPPSPPPVT
jgi:hypothetical protein